MSRAPVFPLVIAGYDGLAEGHDALALGALLAQDGGSLIAARVFEPEPRLNAARHAEERRAQAQDLATAAAVVGAAVERPVARSPAAGLHDLAAELEANLLVVGSSRLGPNAGVLAGGTGERLLRDAPCAVALAPVGFRERDQRLRVIGVGFDGSPEADLALDEAVRLGEAHDTTMRIFTVADPRAPSPRDTYEHAAREAEGRAPAALRAATQLISGDPAAVLHDEAEKGLDLLAVGSRGFGPLRRTVSGSVATTLMRDLACPLLVFPRGARAPDRLERLPAPSG